MAAKMPKRLPFGSFLLPLLRAKQARSLSVIDSSGERLAAHLPPSELVRQLRPTRHPLRFRL